MINSIEILLYILFPITIISFIIFAIIGASIKIQMWSENFFDELKNFKLGIPSMTITIIGFILIFSIKFLENKLARQEIIEFLKHKNKMFAEGKQLDSLEFPFKQISKTSDNRNTGKKKIRIVIKNEKDSLKIRLERSFISDEKYWVYLEKYNSTKINCIGEINTNLLNEY